ncbi:hypothetical protein [Geodermatophilus sp. URMC 62]|uniref:hypothetical protein n=1 Tax=Geodermatophilus sp. URMC 62 TaxID=3423414 RepID=UPI00406D07B4
MIAAVVLLGAGFLLGMFCLSDERARLIALREEVHQKSLTMQKRMHSQGADLPLGDELPLSGRRSS